MPIRLNPAEAGLFGSKMWFANPAVPGCIRLKLAYLAPKWFSNPAVSGCVRLKLADWLYSVAYQYGWNRLKLAFLAESASLLPLYLKYEYVPTFPDRKAFIIIYTSDRITDYISDYGFDCFRVPDTDSRITD